MFEENVIFKNEKGIFVNSDGDPVVRKNRIHENKKSGIQIKGKGTFEENEVFKNKTFGIHIDSKADPVVRKNQLYKNYLVFKKIGLGILFPGLLIVHFLGFKMLIAAIAIVFVFIIIFLKDLEFINEFY